MTQKLKRFVIAALVLAAVLVTVLAVSALADDATLSISMADYNTVDQTHEKPVISGVGEDPYTIYWINNNDDVVATGHSADLPADIDSWDAGEYTLILQQQGKNPAKTNVFIDTRTIATDTSVRIYALPAGSSDRIYLSADADGNFSYTMPFNNRVTNFHAFVERTDGEGNPVDYYLEFVPSGSPLNTHWASADGGDTVGTFVYSVDYIYRNDEKIRLANPPTFTLTVNKAEAPFYIEGENAEGGITSVFGENLSEKLAIALKQTEGVKYDKDVIQRTKVYYSFDNGVTWSDDMIDDDLPAGTYDFAYKVVENEWFEAKEKHIPVTVTAKHIDAADITLAESTAIYTGSAIEFVPNYGYYYLAAAQADGEPIVDAGQYTVVVSVPDAYKNSLIIDGTASFDVTVDKAYVTLRPNAVNLFFGDEAKDAGAVYLSSDIVDVNAIIAELAAKGTLTFDFGGYEKGEAVGEYVITPKFTWNDEAEGATETVVRNFVISLESANLRVAKRVIDIEWLGQNDVRTYTGENYEIKAQFTDVDGNVVALPVTTATPVRNAGVYRAMATLPDEYTENYALPTEFTALYEVQKAVVAVPEIPAKDYRFNGSAQRIDIAENVAYTVENGERTNIGSQSGKIALADPDNYVWSTGTSDDIAFDFEIKKAVYDMSGVSFNDISVPYGTAFTVALDGEIPEGLDGTVPTVTFVNADKTEVGKYTLRAVFATDSYFYEVPADMTATLTVKWVEQASDTKTVEENKESVKVKSDDGIDPDIRLVVSTIEVTDKAQTKNVVEVLKKSEDYKKLDRVFVTYDVSLEKDNVKVQPDGMIYVYLAVPAKLANANYRILHIHEGVATEIEHTLEDGYAVVKTDKLSEFSFVCEQTSLLAWIIVLSVLVAFCALTLVLLLLQAKKNGTLANLFKKNGTTLAAAAPIFFVPGHLAAVIALAVVLLLLIAADVYLIVNYIKNVGVDGFKAQIASLFGRSATPAVAGGAPAPAAKVAATSAKAKNAAPAAAPVAPAPKKTEDEIWSEEAKKYIADGGLAGEVDDESGEDVVGVFFNKRKYKIYYFKYDGAAYEAGEVAAYTTDDGKEMRVVVALPKIRRDAAKLHTPLKTLHKLH
ncbi:MAG: hypothetical protein MJ082_00730 [Clostridia bacterium]|nr:hypothetical protein [Clostridia bacterium]